jgi:hypothetical protein
MKHVFLFCAGLCFSLFASAQTQKYDHNGTAKASSPIIPDTLKVSLMNDNLLIVYKGREVPSANIQVLDSLIKKVPIKQNLAVKFESVNADVEKIRKVQAVLKKCECPTESHSISMQKQ